MTGTTFPGSSVPRLHPDHLFFARGFGACIRGATRGTGGIVDAFRQPVPLGNLLTTAVTILDDVLAMLSITQTMPDYIGSALAANDGQLVSVERVTHVFPL